MDDPVAMVGRDVGASIRLPLSGGASTTVSAARAFDAALEDGRFATWVRARFVQRGNSEAAACDVNGDARLDGDEWSSPRRKRRRPPATLRRA